MNILHVILFIKILDKVTFHDYNRVLALDLTHDDLHNLHQDVFPMFTTNRPLNEPLVLDNPGSTGLSIPPSRFDDLLLIINDGYYTRDSQNLILSILACTADVSLVPHGNLTACVIQVHLHCDVEARR